MLNFLLNSSVLADGCPVDSGEGILRTLVGLGLIFGTLFFIKYGHRRRWKWAVYLRWYIANCDWTEEEIEQHLAGKNAGK